MAVIYYIASTQAQDLDNLFQDTRDVSENALEAANAYNNIVSAIDDAYNISLSANMSAFMVSTYFFMVTLYV